MSAGATPDFAVYEAPAHWRAIDFISDLHLSEQTPRTFDAWADHLCGTDADAVFILGDLFEVWIGDDTRSRPFERRCVEMLQQASRHRIVGFMAGNRDFLLGPAMLADCGVERLRDPTVLRAFGKAWLLTHGDALCLDDTEYQAFRREVRSPAWQQAFLARPVDERAGVARAIRSESQARKGGSESHGIWADVDTAAALAWLGASGCTTMIHGHTHRPGRHALATGCDRQVLSDWDFEALPPRADVLRLDAHGLHRRVPAAAG
jgi:UDP-2,3-diacylglucosamine hydrolase